MRTIVFRLARHLRRGGRCHAALVVVSMRAEGRYSTDTPAAMLGNGCSRSTPNSEIGIGLHDIAPAPNGRP